MSLQPAVGTDSAERLDRLVTVTTLTPLFQTVGKRTSLHRAIDLLPGASVSLLHLSKISPPGKSIQRLRWAGKDCLRCLRQNPFQALGFQGGRASHSTPYGVRLKHVPTTLPQRSCRFCVYHACKSSGAR